MTHSGTDTPPPGSAEARERGCTCPVLDNGHGKGSGRVSEAGEPLYWIFGNCPLHGCITPEMQRQAIENIRQALHGPPDLAPAPPQEPAR